MLSNFEGSSFLANVGEASAKSGLAPLQEQLLFDILGNKGKKINDPHEGMNQIRKRLYSKRVLVVLDDVDQLIQLEYLTGGGCLAPGSRVIVTTRDKHTLHSFNEAETIIYSMDVSNAIEAFQLFCRNAFLDYKHAIDYVELSIALAEYTSCVPLALKVLGSYLHGRTIEEWESALERLKIVPDKNTFDVLKISYDGLDSEEKEIFLDIACFFNGENKDSPIETLNSVEYHAENGIRVLADKHVITISYDRIWMHDLLQEMGRQIVWEEDKQPENRSRFWLIDDLYHVLNSKRVSVNVKGITLECCGPEERQLNGKGFSRLENLRMLKVNNLNISGRLDDLPNELRYLQWFGWSKIEEDPSESGNFLEFVLNDSGDDDKDASSDDDEDEEGE